MLYCSSITVPECIISEALAPPTAPRPPRLPLFFFLSQIIAEALRVVGSIVKIVRPLSVRRDAMVDNFAYQPLVQPLYNAIFPRLSAHDIDQARKYV